MLILYCSSLQPMDNNSFCKIPINKQVISSAIDRIPPVPFGEPGWGVMVERCEVDSLTCSLPPFKSEPFSIIFILLRYLNRNRFKLRNVIYFTVIFIRILFPFFHNFPLLVPTLRFSISGLLCDSGWCMLEQCDIIVIVVSSHKT